MKFSMYITYTVNFYIVNFQCRNCNRKSVLVVNKLNFSVGLNMLLCWSIFNLAILHISWDFVGACIHLQWSCKIFYWYWCTGSCVERTHKQWIMILNHFQMMSDLNTTLYSIQGVSTTDLMCTNASTH